MKQLLTDKPLNDSGKDYFQRKKFAQRIAEIVATPKNDKSIVIGLYGKWGEGKTSVMNFIEATLPDDTVRIKFNPWLFSDQNQLLKSLLNEISISLGKSLKKNRERLGEHIGDYADAISSITEFVGYKFEGAKNIGEKLAKTSIEELKKRVDDAIIESKKNIVIFIDDIDRLDKNEIQQIFKLVKLVGDFPRTSYILAFDDELVAKSIGPIYGGDINSGYSFLEKIIQLPLRIPKSSRNDMRRYVFDKVDAAVKGIGINLSGKDQEAFSQNFETYLLPFIDNPRLAIRYANTLYYSIVLLKDEVNLPDLMLIEAVKVVYPQLYYFIRDNPELFILQVPLNRNDYYEPHKPEVVKEKINVVISLYSEKEQKNIVDLLQSLFPQLKNVYRNIGYSNDAKKRWKQEKFICTTEYFYKYFSYCVDSDDISDVRFWELFSNLSNSQNDLEKEIIAIFSSIDPEKLLDKLRDWIDTFNSTDSKLIAITLCKLGEFYKDQSHFLQKSVKSRFAYSILDLVNNVSDEEQFSLIVELIKTSEPIGFAIEILYNTTNLRLSYRQDKFMTLEEQNELTKILYRRINNLGISFWLNLPERNRFSLFRWCAEAGFNIDKITKRIVRTKLLSSEKVLKWFCSEITSYGIEPKTFYVKFTQENYNLLQSLLTPSILYDFLIKEYGSLVHLVDNKHYDEHQEVSDSELIGFFQSIHEKMLNALGQTNEEEAT